MPSFGLVNNPNFVLVMYKDVKLIKNEFQCALCNYSKCHYLEPLIKGVIAKMTYLAEFWLILEGNLVESSPHKMFY